MSKFKSRFLCLNCAGEKTLDIDLYKRQISWCCTGCNREYQQNIFNLKQKSLDKLSEVEREILTRLIFVSLCLQEPVLGKDWPELIESFEEWSHWAD